MKILNAIHAQSIGGVDQMFRNYTAALNKVGHEVALLISNSNNCDYKDVKKIFKLNNFSPIFDFLHLWFILIVFRPDIVICHSNRIMKWMGVLKKLTNATPIAVNHGISFKSSLHCDYIININQEIHKMVVCAGFKATNSFVIPNMIEISEPYQKREIKEPLMVAMYGRIEPRKGFDIFIKACAILIKEGQDISLKIGGFEVDTGYNLQTIKNFARENNILEKCNFVGIVKDKKEFFKDVDIFVVPSREEPFGLVILEGFANSVLTISSDSDGGKLLIKDGQNGLLFENENYKDLAKKIDFIKKNKEKYCDFTKKSYELLVKNYGFEAFLANFSQIFAIFDKKKS